MEKYLIVKQSVGIDIGKDEFYACYTILDQNGQSKIKGTKGFENNPSGMNQFINWCSKLNKTPEVSLLFLMEATGVYHEELSYFLHNQEQKVLVVLAQKVKYFAKSCNLKTKTDRVDSKMIAAFALERHFLEIDYWTPPCKDFKIIRDLAREHTSLQQARIAIKNQKHALVIAHNIYQDVLDLKEQQLKFYDLQIKKVEQLLRGIVDQNKEFSQRLEKLSTIKGLKFITLIKILAETNGFLLFKNIRQLVSYAGLDVIEKESGKFVGKTRISKKGNARIRAALYMPALTALQHNKSLRVFYQRINEDRQIKRQGVIAVMRKLLILTYTLWKKNEEYDENYQDTLMISG